jgi:hypothetical protein
MKLLTDEEIEKRILPGEYRVMPDVRLGARLQLEEDLKDLQAERESIIVAVEIELKHFITVEAFLVSQEWQDLKQKILGGEL